MLASARVSQGTPWKRLAEGERLHLSFLYSYTRASADPRASLETALLRLEDDAGALMSSSPVGRLVAYLRVLIARVCARC